MLFYLASGEKCALGSGSVCLGELDWSNISDSAEAGSSLVDSTQGCKEEGQRFEFRWWWNFFPSHFHSLGDQVVVTGITGAHVHVKGTRVMGICVTGPHATGARVTSTRCMRSRNTSARYTSAFDMNVSTCDTSNHNLITRCTRSPVMPVI